MKFIDPDFARGSLELRYEEGVVCIYGTADGLLKFADMITSLTKHPREGHIHIEHRGQDLLTPKSERGAIAIFEKTEEN